MDGEASNTVPFLRSNFKIPTRIRLCKYMHAMSMPVKAILNCVKNKVPRRG